MSLLNSEETKRYARQMLLDNWGESGQEKIKRSTVFVAGAGGLASPAAFYLAAAGVGHLRVCDFDSVDLSNLNRQILHDASRVGVPKALSAQTTLEALNPHIRVTALTDRIDAGNLNALVADADIIVDCMDNFPTRFLLNQCAMEKRIPLVYGSIWGLDGRLAFLRPPETACLRCLIAEGPPKEVFPVLGATPGVIGCLQAMEALKYLAGVGSNLAGKMLIFDGSLLEFTTVKIQKDPACSACAHPAGLRNNHRSS